MSQTVVLYCPIPPKRRIDLRLKSGAFKFTGLGLERRCGSCGEYWPYDTEFFYPIKANNDLDNACKACYRENRRNRESSNKRKAK